jgi:prolyl oligopeptidase
VTEPSPSTAPSGPPRRDAAPSDPPAVRRDDLVEGLHGHRVADPYRWLETPADDPEVRAFVDAQQAHAEAHLATYPARHAFRSRLQELWSHPRRGAPWRRADRWFQLRNDGTQEQDTLWTAAAEPDHLEVAPPDAAWTVLVDPSSWSADGTASLSGLAVSDDGTLVAIARSDAGSDWLTWRVVEAASGRWRDDEVRWSRFSGAAWLPDGSGFLYAAYPPPTPGEEHAAALRDQHVRLHRLGTDADTDPLLHARPDQPEWGFSPRVTHDGRWVVLEVWRGTDPETRVHVAPLEGDRIGEVRPLLDAADASYHVLGALGDELLVVTDRDAPLGRIVAVHLDDGSIREVVGEQPDPLVDARLVGGHGGDDPAWLVCQRLHHAAARLVVHDARRPADHHEVDLPAACTVISVTGGRRDHHVHLAVETFTTPVTLLRHDLVTAATSVLPGDDAASPTQDAEVATDVEVAGDRAVTGDGQVDGRTPVATDLEVVVEQVRIHHDGVAVPLFLIHRADVVADGTVPTVLWGYGGFRIPITPAYRPAWTAWVEAGGLLAVACLRGGGEYGRAWHDDGRLAAKPHVFDDALACAAWLTGRRSDEVHATALTDGAELAATWTAPHHLGIEGRSNGGLLAGACLAREPEAFGSVVPEVGVLDLVRFHRFTIGWAWTSDYGDPEDPDDLAVQLTYSPYHRVEAGRAYPPTLVTTADTDDRVVPAHSFKFAAALQAAQGGDAPVLLRVDTSAGHGAGKPVSKQIEERADVLAFHAAHLGLELRPER